jgi:hypothetical protein
LVLNFQPQREILGSKIISSAGVVREKNKSSVQGLKKQKM